MICDSCHRRLLKPAAFSLGKPIGPTCAKRMGLIEPKRRGSEPRAVPVMPGQMRLDLEEVSR